jgi:hypothetical protein
MSNSRSGSSLAVNANGASYQQHYGSNSDYQKKNPIIMRNQDKQAANLGLQVIFSVMHISPPSENFLINSYF